MAKNLHNLNDTTSGTQTSFYYSLKFLYHTLGDNPHPARNEWLKEIITFNL